ncbi:Response regulator receiver domain protein [Shewanella psychrophila]|uniref:Response regulator receiver domain protein n=1 Tax=Shewanella psychrophila TaxID=225848 RepID=A0A1S6HVX1_9GAMM|nr:response regulator [Shewanella psychrophila]AQS39705.1 Response regulator receiver domain protein [Shewanella psychrophila]
MTNKAKLACRQPKVIMIYENEDDILGAASIIADQVDEYRTVMLNSEIGDKIQIIKPSVLLFALANVQRSIELYTKLINDLHVDYPHYGILLCKNRESGVAFRCCIKGLFDNYFVYQPLYEKFRLKMIVHNGLQISQSVEQYKGFNEEQFEFIGEELTALIDAGGECKQSLLDSISKCKQQMKKAEASLIEENKRANISSKALIEKMNKTHIEPLLAELESNIKIGLDGMLQQLLAKQLGLKDLENRSLEMSSIKALDPQMILEALSPEASLSEETIEITDNAKRILVVEDNQIYREMLVKVLTKEAYRVDEAADGLSALTKIRNNQYSLILMDLFMPNLDGINTTKQIKTINGGEEVPVIALTGNKNKELIKKWAEQGLQGYILKPSSKHEILDAVSRTAI